MRFTRLSLPGPPGPANLPASPAFCLLAYWLLMFMAARCRRLICASFLANEIYNFIWRPLQ